MKKAFFGILFLLIAIVCIGSFHNKAYATVTHKLTGWAWSSNIGWVSLNCLNSGPCGAPCTGASFAYGLCIDDKGYIQGYAWSSSIGWLKFGGMKAMGATFPTGPGTVSDDAQISTSTGAVTGWARACDGTLGGNCSSMTARTDGWDGWISMSGTNYPSDPNVANNIYATSTKGVTFNKTYHTLTGYSWGSDVIGWLYWSPMIEAGGPPDVPPAICADGCGASAPRTLSATCAAVPAVSGTISAPTSEQYTISNVTGNAGSVVSYAWDGYGFDPTVFPSAGSFSSSNQATFVYSNAGSNYRAGAYLTDTNGDQGSVACTGTFTVTNPNGANGVQMWLNSDPTKTTQTISVRPNTDVNVYTTFLDAYYTYSNCTEKLNGVTIPGKTGVNPAGHDYGMPPLDDLVSQLGVTGTYKFTLICNAHDPVAGTDASTTAQTSSSRTYLQINVVNPSMEEI